MTDDSREALIYYRLERAKQALKEADYTAEGGFYNVAINRLYYACFYAAVALLQTEEINCMTHSGVKTLFSQHFVKTNILSIDHAWTFKELFSRRQASDYEDFV